MTEGRVMGTGVDLVENDRMRHILKRWGRRFKDRVFLEGEQVYCDGKGDPGPHYAGRFAVKEAVAKALGTGLGVEFGWRDIEVVRDGRTGAPSVGLSDRGRRFARSRGIERILVSLSHTRSYAVAHALALEA